MEISVENVGTLERKVRIEVPEDKVQTLIVQRLQKLMKTTKIPGFRPGKVPMKMIEKRYGEAVRKEVIGELVQSSFYEAITQENLSPAGSPQIDNLTDEIGSALSYTATFEIYPVMTLKAMDELNIDKPICAVSSADVANMIEVLRKQRRELKPVERPAKLNDILDIDFEGLMDGQAFAGSRAEHYQLELGSKNFIEGFETGLLEKSAGQDVSLTLRFPKDYGEAALCDKEVLFNVKINSVNESVLPQVDADFMKGFGLQDGGKEKFESELKRNMEREVEATLNRQLKEIVFTKLREENTVELPQVLVKNERHRLQHELEHHLKQQGNAVAEQAKIEPELLTEQAEKRIALQLIVTEIVKQNELKANPKKVREMIERAAAGYEDPNAVVNWYYSDQKKLAEIESLALEEGVVEWILACANITEKEYTFDEVMNKVQT